MDFNLAARQVLRKLPAFATRDEITAEVHDALVDAHERGRIEGRLEILTGVDVGPTIPS